MKSKLGISVGLFGAGIYLGSLVGGTLVAFLLLVYVLMFEENEWLKVTAIKAAALVMLFAFIALAVDLIPSSINTFDSFLRIFDGDIDKTFITQVFYFVSSAIGLIKTIVFLLLGVNALSQKSSPLPVIDGLVKKHYMRLK